MRNNKSRIMLLRCTADEYDYLKKKSKEFNNLSSFLRKLIFDRAKLVVEPKSLIRVVDELAKELHKLGNNINQTARYLNYAEKRGVVSADILNAARSDYRDLKNELEMVRTKLNEIIQL
jgi:uncharacterized protein (DUF1778 family)